jgi:hypothetical protein
MFIELSKEQIEALKKQNMLKQISRWETIEKAKTYYSNTDGIYTAYIEEKRKLRSAYSTPVKVYLITK